jgi:HEAT repeat protein
VITALGESKDPGLASVFRKSLDDQSYSVIRAAALALGQTRSPDAYETLANLAEMPSWRDSIKISALGGLAALGDKRTLDLTLRLAAKGNLSAVRAGALRLLGAIGKDDPRVFPVVAEAIGQALDKADSALTGAAAEALADLGDPRGLAIFDEMLKKTERTSFTSVLTKSQERLRRIATGPATSPTYP